MAAVSSHKNAWVDMCLLRGARRWLFRLAAAHPEIKTYAGRGIDDPAATVRADLTPLGFHASVRSQSGQWYVDPYYHQDQSLYASYYGHDLTSSGPLQEKDILGTAKKLQ